jgi:aryl-alcohol dehydrogenase-like predicted oxidoreductase
MEYVTLGRTGTKVSRLCLGTWRFGRETGGVAERSSAACQTPSDDVVETDKEEAHDLLDAAWDRGINFIDITRTRSVLVSCQT